MTAKLEISTLAFFTVSFLSISTATNNKTETFIAKTFTKNPTNTHKYPISLSLSQSHYQLTLTFSILLPSHSNSLTNTHKFSQILTNTHKYPMLKLKMQTERDIPCDSKLKMQTENAN